MIVRPVMTSGRDRGFTLVELLVVIGIIMLLAALVLTVGTGLLRQSDVRATQNTMRLLDIAVQEWETTSDRQIQYGLNGQPCDVDERYELQQVRESGAALGVNDPWGEGSTGESAAYEDAIYTTDRMWAVYQRTTNVRDIIARVSPDFVLQADVQMHANDSLSDSEAQTTFRFLDGWDREIIAVLPGRPHNARCAGSSDGGTNGFIRDADGTIRTPFENRFGAASDRRVFFVSAGPSGVFGNLHLDTASNALSETQREEIRDAEDNIYSFPIQIEQARAQQ